jgi:tetratricopeptide (TPR) repeat protein
MDSSQLVEKTRLAILEGKYPDAIRLAWDAINRKSDEPASWFLLSYAYLKHGQYLNAETAALEAKRINPKNKTILMHYLAVTQKSQSPARFHDEVIKAYRDYPGEPELILALARSYARIRNDLNNSAAMYRKYLERAPEGPKKEAVARELKMVE